MSKKLETLKSLAMVDVAYELLSESNRPLAIQELFTQIAEIKGISLDDIDKLTQLYMDITQSALFVYCGDDKWNLKEGNLHLWDDDGSSFIEVSEEEDDEETITVDLSVFDDEEDEDEEIVLEDEDEDQEELDEETKEAIKEEQEYIEVELPLVSTDDDDVEFDADDYDEDDYNKIMDNYEDMYDE